MLCWRSNAHHASEGDEDGEELPLVPDDHAVGDARKLGLELALKKQKNGRPITSLSFDPNMQETPQF